MQHKISDHNLIDQFETYLIQEEKSRATVEKYLRDVRCFFVFLSNRTVTKEVTVAYKKHLSEQYAPASVNSMLVALNVFLRFAGASDCCVKLMKIQRQIFCREDKELTKGEYQRLVKAAGSTQLSYVIQTICGTGIRVSGLEYITAEAVRRGDAVVQLKGKTRVIFIPDRLRKALLMYLTHEKIVSGPVFVTRKGNPLDRSNIWKMMKALCLEAGVNEAKVFPHNLRHLFARTYYEADKDMARLADVLGHSSIATTRIYIMTSGQEHRRHMERMDLFL